MGGRCLCVVFLVLFLSIPSQALVVEDDFQHNNILQINQGQYGNNNACGPFAILYALKYGPPYLQNRYHSLPGNTDYEKVDHLVGIGRQLKSALKVRDKIFSDVDGMYDHDVAPLINSIGNHPPSFYQRQQLSRNASEKSAGPFTQRVYQAIRYSLDRGYPVIAGIQGRIYDPDKKKWVRTFAHTVTIFGLQADFVAGDIQFAISYYEPWTGEYQYGFLFEETRQSFAHKKRELINGVEKITKIKLDDEIGKIDVKHNKRVSSPFLLMQSPSFYAGHPSDYDKREIIILDNLNLFPQRQPFQSAVGGQFDEF